MRLAPIVLFVYNRPWHTQQVLETLANNDLADQSILYVFADGPKPNASAEQIKKIKQTEEVVIKFTSFKELNFVKSDHNIGCADSIIGGITQVVNKHGKIIIVEDDIVTGKGFLKYMNEALTLYENEDDVICIHAFNYPIQFKNVADTFFLKGADCWGWGTWKRGWDQFNPDTAFLLNEIERRNLQKSFNQDGAYDYTNLLRLQLDGEIDAWDIRFHASAFLNNKLTLHPRQSLVKNIGLDGSGTHRDSISNAWPYVDYCPVYPIPVEESKSALKYIKKYHIPSFSKRIISNLKRIARGSKKLLKLFVPPVIYQIKYRFQGDDNHTLFKTGNYSGWDDALRDSRGYDDSIIFKAVKTALVKVKNREAVYERDSVLFDKVQHSWGLVACLQKIAIENQNRLNLLDFGGSLGTSYFQNRNFLKGISFLWNIVEQRHFVEFGKKEFESDSLKFFYTIEEVLKDKVIHCILLSSVIQYLESPDEWINKFINTSVKYILIDRTGFIENQKDILTVQNVPEEIYHASYPCWFFNENSFLKKFKKYSVLADFDNSFDPPMRVSEHKVYWKGFLLAKNE